MHKYERYWDHLQLGWKMPRKAKKYLIGTKMSRNKLRKLLNSVVIIPQTYPASSSISPHPFCPKCGCVAVIHGGNLVEYPEVYIRDNCARCYHLVGMADNSPYYHALEFKHSEYNIDI